MRSVTVCCLSVCGHSFFSDCRSRRPPGARRYLARAKIIIKSCVDIIWVILFGGFLFVAGVAYQWYADKNPVFPFTLFGLVLDNAENSLAETLQLTGLRKPRYYFRTALTARDMVFDPASAQPGLTLITAVGDDARLEAKVVELNGTIVQQWTVDWFEIWPDATHVPAVHVPKRRPGTHIHGARIVGNGDLIFNFELLGLVRMNVCGDVVWRLPYLTHHSIDIDPATGNLWVSGRRFHQDPVATLPNHSPPFAEPTLVEVTPAGRIVQEISIIDVLIDNDLQGLLYMQNFGDIQRGHGTTTGDTLHLNDVEIFPRRLAEGFFKHGDLMVSLRNIHTILVFDQNTGKIKYLKTGNFVGQHDPDFIDGNTISVFDNNVAAGQNAERRSRIVILSPLNDSREIYFQGNEKQDFYTNIMGKHQWMPNGNLLLTESTGGRAFEIDPNGEIVWQYVNLIGDQGWVGMLDEAQRLPLTFDRAFFAEQRRRCSG